jgi:hypothetical protein
MTRIEHRLCLAGLVLFFLALLQDSRFRPSSARRRAGGARHCAGLGHIPDCRRPAMAEAVVLAPRRPVGRRYS